MVTRAPKTNRDLESDRELSKSCMVEPYRPIYPTDPLYSLQASSPYHFISPSSASPVISGFKKAKFIQSNPTTPTSLVNEAVSILETKFSPSDIDLNKVKALVSQIVSIIPQHNDKNERN